MKQRFSSLDVQATALELGRLLPTLYLQNIYDLSSRILLLKFARPGQPKQQLLLDIGFRCHLTAYARPTAGEPGAFTARLRRLLRGRRLAAARQVGADRVLELVFGDDARCRVFLEFFAEGNVIVTDAEYRVLALHRRVAAGERQEALTVGAVYEVRNRQGVAAAPEVSRARLKEGIAGALAQRAAAAEGEGKKGKKKAERALSRVLAGTFMQFPPVLLEHAARLREFDLTTPLDVLVQDEERLDRLMEVLREAGTVVESLAAAETPKGYIIAKPMKTGPPKGAPPEAGPTPGPAPSLEASAPTPDTPTPTPTPDAAPTLAPTPDDAPASAPDAPAPAQPARADLMYEDLQPFLPAQHAADSSLHVLTFDGFNAAADAFFSSIESQRLTARLNEREAHAARKLAAAKADHERRIGGLQEVQALNVRRAAAIEGNLHRVEEAIRAVNGLVAQGMDWVEMARLIEMEQQRGNPVAAGIKLPLKLYENTVTLLLDEGGDEDEDEDEEAYTERDSASDSDEPEDDGERPTKRNGAKDKRLAVDIDLGLTPWANAGEYYSNKKTAAVKQDKTAQSASIALKSAAKKINADLKKGLQQEKAALRPVRAPLWFEKFYYFLSSEGYLVLGGHDAQQSDLLYTRYCARGDAWVHADVEGAVPFVVKNKPGAEGTEIPPSTLAQAGTLCVASSSAWESKAVMAAWWVGVDQVTKTASTGDILQPGRYEIRGQKTYLPPAQLLLGFGVMFRISKESKRRHMRHRVDQDGPGLDTNEDNVAREAKSATEEPEGQTGASSSGPLPQINDQEAEERCEANGDADDEDLMVEEDASDEKPDNDPHEEQNNDADDYEETHDANDQDRAYNNPLLSQADNPLPQNADTRDRNDSKDEDTIDEEDEDAGDESTVAKDGTNSTQPPPPASDAPPNDPPASDHAPSTAPSVAAQPAAPVRGKHGQRAKKKKKKKYEHQDEEDRALALRLLGATGAAGAPAKPAADTDKQAAREAQAQAQRERKRAAEAKQQQHGQAAEATRQARLASGADGLEPAERAELALAADFVGAPRPGDEILDALAVCGPWSSLGPRLRWRVKLQPGATKRGKALREILGGWERAISAREKRRLPGPEEEGFEEERGLRREGELIKGIRDVEVVGVVPVKAVRVVAGAGETAGGGDRGKGGKGGGKGGGKATRGGKGSKKAR